FVEHLHVAAQRDPGDGVFGAVAADALPERLAKAHREAQHAHAAAPRDPVMAELVEGDQDAEAHDEPPHRAEEFHHCRRILAIKSPARRRAAASVSSRSSREPAGPPGWASRQAWTR